MNKKDIDQLPTNIRNILRDYCQARIEKAEGIRRDAADSFVVTSDERQRALALISRGEVEAFTEMYNWFK